MGALFRRLGGVSVVALGPVLALGVLSARATMANTITLVPNDPVHIPDESQPRGVQGDAPTVQFGTGSWENTAHVALSGDKVNAYVTPEELFGHSVTINDIQSISYWTKAPATQENWFLNIYTEKTATIKDGSFYGHRFFNSDYTGYTSDGTWHQDNVGLIQRSSGGSFAAGSISSWQNLYGAETIASFSPQTNSALNGNDAQIDGMTITLKDDEVGYVNFEAVAAPLPSTAWAGLTLMAGMAGFQLVKRYNGRTALA